MPSDYFDNGPFNESKTLLTICVIVPSDYFDNRPLYESKYEKRETISTRYTSRKSTSSSSDEDSFLCMEIDSPDFFLETLSIGTSELLPRSSWSSSFQSHDRCYHLGRCHPYFFLIALHLRQLCVYVSACLKSSLGQHLTSISWSCSWSLLAMNRLTRKSRIVPLLQVEWLANSKTIFHFVMPYAGYMLFFPYAGSMLVLPYAGLFSSDQGTHSYDSTNQLRQYIL